MFDHFSLTTVRGYTSALCLSLLVAGCNSDGSGETPATTATALAQSSSSQSSVSQSSQSSVSQSSSQSSASQSSSQSSASQSSSSVSSSSSSSQASRPQAPTNLVATPGNARVTLTWTASTGATSYGVKRATASNGPYTQLTTVTSASYADTGAVNGTLYFYVVTAINTQGTSANSAQVSATPVAAITVPPVPTLVVAVSINSQVSLTWVASLGATSYKVKRATSSTGAYSQLATPTAAAYIDSAVSTGQTYYYVVAATNSAGDSANSAQVNVAITIPTPPPTSFGTWINVTPSNVNLTDQLSCGNYGTASVQVDPAHPSNLYAQFNCQGIWKSGDYGATWTGPINTGANAATVTDCAGGITIPPGSTASVPTIYLSCGRGAATGFWRSLDGGVNWTRYVIAPTPSRQDYYPPAVDPYDVNHLIMAGHEMNSIVESFDGGQNWTAIPFNNGMLQNGGTAAIFFVNTGNATTTRTTWMWMAQWTGGAIGTWRTTNSGSTWVQVDKNEHTHGSAQIYQPDNNGVVFMAGAYSDLGWGILRSTNYGQTWTHVGPSTGEGIVIGTSKNLYAMFGYPTGAGGITDPAFEIAAQPGTGTWTTPGTPANMTQGPAQMITVNDGTHNILVGAMWNGGLWRYIEP